MAWQTPLSRDEVRTRVQAALDEPGAPCIGTVGGKELSLRVGDDQRSTWSPWLSLELRGEPDATLLFGRFGPQPELWTLFVFVYSALVAVFTGCGVFGLTQMYALNAAPTALWGTASASMGLAVACSIDLIGRRVGSGQMGIIRGFLIRTLPEGRDEAGPL